MLVALEVITGVLNLYTPQIHGDAVGINHACFVHDPVLGFRLGSGAIARQIGFYGRQQEFNVTYVIDQLGRRETPVASKDERHEFLLFFGDSNTFGEGVPQHATLPYWAGKFAQDYEPYNYGVPGWGPAQMLDLLKTRDLRREVRQTEGYAFFFFIQHHIARVIGSSDVSAEWGRHFPHYVLDAEGHLVREDNFATGRPFTTLFYDLIDSSNIAQYFDITLPRQYSAEDYRLTAKIMRESQDILEKEFELRDFYVVISPSFNSGQMAIYRRFMEALRKVGVKYLDYTALYDINENRYRVGQYDGHNSGLGDRLIAEAIVRDLRLQAVSKQ
jgi:hypothetical protein